MLFMTDHILFIMSLSSCLFFGAAFLPIAYNLMIDDLSPVSKTLGSSFAQMAFNLFGFFPPNIIYGQINTVYGYFYAMFWNMMPGAIGLLSMGSLAI